MTEVLEYAHYGEALGNAASVIRSNVGASGLDAGVPTCPGWTTRDLVVHVGRVYRWAAAQVRGESAPGRAELEAEAAAASDPLDWFDEGLVDVLNALGNAPDDLNVPFFLPNAPSSRVAWARRQTHESTVHAIDAMAARLGRPPTVGELWFSTELAADGIEEFLTGWWPVVDADPGEVAVIAEDGSAWVLGPGAGDVRRADAAAAGTQPIRLMGSTRGIYQFLWNRGGDATITDPGFAQRWREQVRV